jgi:hypothetical protein
MSLVNALPTKADTDAMESLIDRVGMYETLSLVAAICGEKAAHIRENWQDDSAAKWWDKLGAALTELDDLASTVS